MSSFGNNQGSSVDNPIDLLSSSPETQRTSRTVHVASDSSDEGTSVGERSAHVDRPPVRPKREPASPEGDIDSDQGHRRTHTFRGDNRDWSSSSGGQGSSSQAPQMGGTLSNPIVLGEAPIRPIPLQRPREPGPSRASQGGSADLWRRSDNYADANPPPPNPTPVRTGAAMSRPAQSPGTPSAPAPTAARISGLPAVSLPRWQPDAEVTYCPICHTQFSFFIRKHHCRFARPLQPCLQFHYVLGKHLHNYRKCGRVVCDACSPHRITIPYQYIVQPPGTPRTSRGEYSASLVAGGGGYADFGGLGGGERVRLCNPCVPDPNITPPQALAQDTPSASSSHARPQSTVHQPSTNQSPLMNRLSAYMGAYTQTSEQHARSRSVTMVSRCVQV